MMRRIVAIAAAAVCMAGASLSAESKTVKGEVVDVMCHTKKGDGGHGEAHKACATACAKKGAAMGIVASDGVYTIEGDYAANNNAKLLDFIAMQVEATGEVSEKDGKKVITVTSMKAAQ